MFELHKLWAIYETAKILTFHPQYLTKTLSCIIPITMLLRVFETPLLNIPLGRRPLLTPSDFWRRNSQHSHADTDYNATDLELSYRFSINHIGSYPLSISLIWTILNAYWRIIRLYQCSFTASYHFRGSKWFLLCASHRLTSTFLLYDWLLRTCHQSRRLVCVF